MAAAARSAAGRVAERVSSVSVFHSPQPGQRPCHFGLSCPQVEQAKTVARRAIPARLSAAVDGFAPRSCNAITPVRAEPGPSCNPSGPRACIRRFVTLLAQPLATAEFLAVDTETNGLAGDLCELTEVGAVLVGGGELHDTFDSVVRTERPLSRAESSASPGSRRR